MERLTRRNSHGSVLVNITKVEKVSWDRQVDSIVALSNRLAEYEDIGLTPEEIIELKGDGKCL